MIARRELGLLPIGGLIACLTATFGVALCTLAANVYGGESKSEFALRPEDYAGRVQPLLARFCQDCHGAQTQEAEVDLSRFAKLKDVLADRETWSKISEMIEFGAMPPDDQPQPTQADRELLVSWINGVLSLDCSQIRDPGRVTIRRLNRAEYDNTIRDLFGLDLHLSRDFPSDDVGEGFDNIGDVLSLPPLLFEKYMDAAEEVAIQALRPDSDTLRKIVIASPGEGLAPQAAARQVLTRFASRAFRRPVQADEVERLVSLVDSVMKRGGTYERGIQVAVAAVLVSPHFLFRVEDDRAQAGAAGIRELNDYELASRLSYFLWSSMPDEALFDLARRGELKKDSVLIAQVRRMLSDPKSAALVENFAGQWLNLRNLDEVTPDPTQFPEFDADLKRAMRRETELLFATVMREDRSVVDFLTADFTFVNERLARHYGLPGIRGDEFQRVPLPAAQRVGLLTQASILTLTSNPTRTSAVKRGKWIMENILGTPPPDPPANVPALEETAQAKPGATLREQLVLHRQNAVCASCHLQMDELGFGFENFDAVGRWRDQEQGKPIDAAGELPGGLRFNGPIELVRILSQRDKQFAEAIAGKMLVYALGRGLEYYDQCAIEQIVNRMEQNEYRLSALVSGIVLSEPFRMRRIEGENP